MAGETRGGLQEFSGVPERHGLTGRRHRATKCVLEFVKEAGHMARENERVIMEV